jgi:hypothetical protein
MPISTCNTPVLGVPASIMGRSFQSTWLRPFVVNRNICNFLWYGGFARGERVKVLGRLGCPSPTKSLCSILPIARRLSGRGVAAPALRIAPPDALSPPPSRSSVCADTTNNVRRYGHPLAGDPGPSGTGLCQPRMWSAGPVEVEGGTLFDWLGDMQNIFHWRHCVCSCRHLVPQRTESSLRPR